MRFLTIPSRNCCFDIEDRGQHRTIEINRNKQTSCIEEKPTAFHNVGICSWKWCWLLLVARQFLIQWNGAKISFWNMTGLKMETQSFLCPTAFDRKKVELFLFSQSFFQCNVINACDPDLKKKGTGMLRCPTNCWVLCAGKLQFRSRAVQDF